MSKKKPEPETTASEPTLVAGLELDTGKRGKRTIADDLRLIFADFKRRTKTLGTSDVDRDLLAHDFDRLVGEVIERHVSTAPVGLRDELRATLRSMLESDPKVSEALADLRRAIAPTG